jgi:hypothetical protein
MIRAMCWVLFGVLAGCAMGSKDPDGGGGQGCGPVSWDHEIQPIVQAHCQTCHSSPPAYGAPAPFVTYADTQQTAVEDPRIPEYQMMANKVTAGLMPSSGPALTADEISLFVAWADAGAPLDECPGTDAGYYDAGTGIQDAGLIDTSTANFKGTANGYTDSPTSGVDENEYHCFSFKVSTGGQVVDAIQFAPILDNTRILHHMILYKISSTTVVPSDYECFGGPTPQADPNTSLLFGWAPGGTPYAFPPEAGMQVQDGDQLVLQLHYHNFTGEPQTDSSGIAMWWTTQMRQYQAVNIALGAVNFTLAQGQQSVSVAGNCSVLLSAGTQVKIFGAFPHMHTYGTHITTTITHAGSTNALVDVPQWSFDNQHVYPVDAVVTNGDSLTTSCTYDTMTATAPVPYGETTEDEMCFDFLYVYPSTPTNLPGYCLY